MKMIFAAMFTVLVSLTVAGSSYATEQRPDEMIVAMASSKTICGGNTGRACPGTAPATAPPPVAASPVIPAPKPAPTPVTPTPPASTPTPGPAPTPPSVTTPVSPASPTTTSTPTAHPMVTATLLGQTGEDVVGTFGGTPDGIKDVHIKLSSVSGTIKGVRITGLDGIWETPANGKNWLVAIRPQSDPSVVDLYFDYFKVISAYIVTLTFSDGATQAFQAATTTPSSIYLPVATSTPIAPTIPNPAPTPTPTVTATTPLPPIPSSGNILVQYAADPVYGNVGFARLHWASSINKMLAFLEPGKETSIRAYDPVANTWEFLWPSNTLGIQGRDNYASFYIPRIDELWVWDGSYLWDNPNSLYSGRFSVSQKRWVAMGKTDTDAFVGVVDMTATGGGMPFSGTDPAMAWAANTDTGLMLGGSDESGEYTYIFEPKRGGPELYKATRLTISRPPWRKQCMNCMVSDGTDFYLSGGAYQEPNDPTGRNRRDLWKFTTATKTWTQLAAPPDIEYAPAVTYDSDLRAIVSWVKNKLYVYDIASNTWSDRTPPGLWCVSNQTAVYAPTAKLHLYQGGNDCATGGGTYMTVAVRLSGTAGSVVTQTPPPTNPASTLSATFRGTSENIDKVGRANQTTPNGTADFHITVSGLRSTPTKVRISSATGGVWETPFNGTNWIIATQYSGTTGDFFFDFDAISANIFHVKVTYADNTTAEVDATNQVSVQTPPVTPPVNPPPPPTNIGGSGCESEGGLAGRTDILKCEGWESSNWWADGGWWEDVGDEGNALDGRRFHHYPARQDDTANTTIVSAGCLSGSCLSVNMLGWDHASGGGWIGLSWNIPGVNGCSHETLGCVPQQEVYMRYYLKLSPNFDPDGVSTNSYYTGTGGGIPGQGGGKFPGLADATNGSSYQTSGGRQCGNGGEGPTDGTECWSIRMTFQPCGVTQNGQHDACVEGGNPAAKTRFGLYPYMYAPGYVEGTRYSAAYMDNDGRSQMDGPCTDTYGFGGGINYGGLPSCGFGAPGLLNDHWYAFEMHVKMNTPGSDNGVIETWLDGVLRYRKTNVNFRNIGHNNIGVRQFWFDVYTGGTGSAMKEDMKVYFDQMVIATGARVGALNEK